VITSVVIMFHRCAKARRACSDRLALSAECEDCSRICARLREQLRGTSRLFAQTERRNLLMLSVRAEKLSRRARLALMEHNTAHGCQTAESRDLRLLYLD
jgi:hypothetical protein